MITSRLEQEDSCIALFEEAAKSSLQEMRLPGSTVRHCLSRSLMGWGINFCTLKMSVLGSLMTLRSSESVAAAKGRCPQSISQQMTPRDQMSVLELQSSLPRSSGLMQKGVPNLWLRTLSSPGSNLHAKPRSTRKVSFWSLTMMLEGLRSLWTIFLEMRYSTPLRMFLNICWDSLVERLFLFLRMDSKVCPLQYFSTKQKQLCSSKVSSSSSTQGECSPAKTVASFFASQQAVLSFADFFTFFMAATFPDLVSAMNT